MDGISDLQKEIHRHMDKELDRGLKAKITSSEARRIAIAVEKFIVNGGYKKDVIVDDKPEENFTDELKEL